MNGIVPVIIVIVIHAVPSAIVRLEGIVSPANTSIRTGNNNVLPSESQGPHLRRVRVIDARLDCFRLKVRRGLDRGAWLRKLVLDVRIAFYPRDVRPGR